MSNIMAGKMIGELLKRMLGPRGMSKILISTRSEMKITSDGATFLKEVHEHPKGFRLVHPVAKTMMEAAKTVETEVGDGTVTVILLIGELLRNAEDLLDRRIHPTTIISGYRIGAERSIRLLDELSVPVDINDVDTLRKVALTSIHGRSLETAEEYFADLAIKAVKQIIEKRASGLVADVDQVNIIKKRGGSLSDTRFVEGIILDDNFVVLSTMPKRVEKARIALVWIPLMLKKMKFGTEIEIKDPTLMRAFKDEEANIFKGWVDKMKASGANVLICQKKDVSDTMLHLLAKEGIMTVRRATEKEMRNLEKATGGRIVMNVDDIRDSDLGHAELVEERKIGSTPPTPMIFVEGCQDPRSVSILIRGGLERTIDEAEAALHSALRVLSDVVKEGKIVAGGGAIEAEIAKRLRAYALSLRGKVQLGVHAFANSLESIPRTLAENAGLDPVDILTSLRSMHEKPDGIWIGVDAFQRKISDMKELGVLEPMCVKEQVIKTAVETAIVILRVDDFIAAKRQKRVGV